MRAGGGGGGAEEGGVGGPEAGGGEAAGAGVGRPAWWRFPAPQERPESRCVAGGEAAAGLAQLGRGSGWFLARFPAVDPRCRFSPISPAGQLTVRLGVRCLSGD